MNHEPSFGCAEFDLEGLSLSYLDSGGDKPVLHFSHANGFPVSVYLPLMSELAGDYRVVGLGHRGQDGRSKVIHSWHRLALDLIAFLESLDAGPVIGVGHSIGAVTTLFSAVRRPDLFSRIVLLDPVLLPPKLVLLARMMKLVGLKGRMPLAFRARRRRNGWSNREEACEYFRERSLFHGWDEKFIRAYVTHGLKPTPDGRVELICPPEAEARGFESYSTDIWSWPPRLRTPTFIVRGEESSEALRPECFEKFLRICPVAQGAVMPGAGHLIPMEKPGETLAIIKDFCSA